MKLRLANGLVIFSILTALLLGSVVIYVVATRVENTLQAADRFRLDAEGALLISQMESFLENRQKILQDHSRFAIVRQTVMQPDEMRAYISDFFQDITVLGERYQQTIVDFEGETIYSTLKSPKIDYSNSPTVVAFLEGESEEKITIQQHHDQYYWMLLEPIYYQGNIEGAIILQLPFTAVLDHLNFGQNGLNTAVSLIKGEERLYSSALASKHIYNNGDLYHSEIVWEKFSLKLRLGVDESLLQQARQELINNLSLMIFSASVLFAVVSFFIGRNLLAQPIQQLQRSARNIIDGGEDNPIDENLIWHETTDVAKDFNRMVATVKKREYQLRNSYDELKQINLKLRESQSQLIQSEKMAGLGTMAAGVAHEINNPVGYVNSNVLTLKEYFQSFAQLYDFIISLDDKPENQPLKQQLVQLIKSSGTEYAMEDVGELLDESIEGLNRISEIITSLKSFSRADNDEMLVNDINQGLKDTLRLAHNELKYHCTLHEDYGDLPLVICNLGQLNQVFMNLVINASQAIEKEGHIFIKTEAKTGYVVITIKDSGKGIPQDALSEIFNPFFTTKPVGQGTGLGLSISHAIVEGHNGKLLVRSKEGVGTEFRVILPLENIQVDNPA